MIPKIIHACWFGPAEMPREQREYLEGWRRLHPDWRIVVWTDETAAPYLEGSAFVEACLARKKYAFLSDYFRLAVLYEFGGVYCDTDIEMFKPLDGFLGCKMFLGFILDSSIGTALIGSEKGNPLLLEWRDILERDFGEKGEFTVNNDWITGDLLARCPDFRLNGKRQSLACGIELYPKDWFERYQVDKKSGGGYCEHHCFNSWVENKRLPLWKRAAKKILPRKLVSAMGHRTAVKKSRFYRVYLTQRKSRNRKNEEV